MNNIYHMIARKFQLTLTAFMLVAISIVISTPLYASGSGNGSWSAGDYHTGKKVFLEKIYCDTCPLAGKELSRQLVEDILPQLSQSGDLGQNLSFKERQSVKQFLRSKFNL